MRRFLSKITVGALLAIIVPQMAQAQIFACYTDAGGPFCTYIGRVARLYVNANNWVLIYFEEPIDVSIPTNKGITGVTDGNAAMISIDAKPEFAKLFYSTALTAQSTGREVVFQMRGSASGYLKADRIWLRE